MVTPARRQFSLRAVLFVTLVVAGVCAGIRWLPELVGEMLALGVVVLTGALTLTRREPLRFFLRYVNPLLALLVLVICLISATVDDQLDYRGFFNGPIATYFLAKGVFCSAALFLLGKLLEHNLDKR